MQGDEFTQRLLTPFEEPKLTMLLRQGYDVDALFRLMGAEVRLENGEPGGVTLVKRRCPFAVISPRGPTHLYKSEGVQ